MPTYDYRCTACSHAFEHFQAMSASPLKLCPKCGKKKLQRLIGTGAAVIFKGSGFYQTDYRSDGYKKAAEADSKPVASQTEAKPAETKASPAAGTDKPGATAAATASTTSPDNTPAATPSGAKPEPGTATNSAAKRATSAKPAHMRPKRRKP